MKSNLLLDKIHLIQTEYKELLATLLPKLKSSHSPEALDEINLFWLRHIEEIQLYLKAWFPGENSYVFTAATFMDFEDNEHLPFLLMGDKHILDDPLSKYSEIRSKMPDGKDAEFLYEQIGVTAEDILVFGCIQQAIDVLVSCIEYGCIPYIRYPVSLHYISLLSESMLDIEHIVKLRFKMSVAFVVYQLCDKGRLARVSLEEFLKQIQAYNFNEKLFRVLAEHDINENSFLGHTITQLVIDELEAFYNILCPFFRRSLSMVQPWMVWSFTICPAHLRNCTARGLLTLNPTAMII